MSEKENDSVLLPSFKNTFNREVIYDSEENKESKDKDYSGY